MTRVLTQVLKMCLAGLLAAGILSAFTMFYYYSGMRRPNPSGATDFLWGPYQLLIDRREGNTILRYDADGFNNPGADLTTPVDNLMMGDSHMQAAHVAADESASAILNKLCPEQYTYNIALGGHHIYSCVNNLENALRKYTPAISVLIDATSVSLDMEEMQRVLDKEYKPYQSYNTGPIAWLQTWLPGLKPIYTQLENWVGLDTEDQLTASAQATPTKAYQRTLNAFLQKAAEAAQRHSVRLIIFYIPPVEIEPGGGYGLPNRSRNAGTVRRYV